MQYNRECFSPLSRRASDWIYEPCSAAFAETRCQVILLWLLEASKLGVSVKHWVVLDDDDLLQKGSSGNSSGYISTGRQRTGPTEYTMAKPVNLAPVKDRMPSPAPAPMLQTPPSIGTASCDDDDDPWAMTF